MEKRKISSLELVFLAKCKNGKDIVLEELYSDLDCEFENDFKIFLSQREVKLKDFTTSCNKNLYKVRVYFEELVGHKEINNIFIKYDISVHKDNVRLPIFFSCVLYKK